MKFGVSGLLNNEIGIYQTKMKQKKSIKPLKILFKYNFTIKQPKNAIISMAIFGPNMVNIYLNNTFNSLIIFSASVWYNKIPISLFQRPETPNFMISQCFNPSPGPKTNFIYLWRGQDTLNKSRIILGTSWKNIIFVNLTIKIFDFSKGKPSLFFEFIFWILFLYIF